MSVCVSVRVHVHVYECECVCGEMGGRGGNVIITDISQTSEYFFLSLFPQFFHF